MHRVLFAALSVLGVTASAQETWIESSVTLALTVSHSGTEQIKPGKNGNVLRTVPLQISRLGNREILEALRAESYISGIEGWQLVAIWADWPDADPYVGSSYRFYARRRTGASMEAITVPSSILSINPLHAEVGTKQVILAEEERVLSGSETLQILSEVRFAAAGLSGDLQGIRSGTGRYVRATDQAESRYVPDGSKAVLSGEFLTDDETRAGLVSGSISFGPGKFVAASRYEAPSGTGAGATIEGVTIDLYNINFGLTEAGTYQPVFGAGVSARINYTGSITSSGENSLEFVGAIQIGSIRPPSIPAPSRLTSP